MLKIFKKTTNERRIMMTKARNVSPKEYNIPKVLFIGNGILRAFGGESWNKFLASIATYEEYKKEENIKKIDCPAPLKAILVTEDKVDSAMREKFKDAERICISEDLKDILYRLMSLEFTHILTTNYTYELENLSTYPDSPSDNHIKKMMSHSSEVNRAESQYLLHTYNEICVDGQPKKIWHIHGEMRKPESAVIGHYYYGNLLFKMKDYLDRNGKTYHEKINEEEIEIKSWLDTFILGDVFCIGAGFDHSDFDLWWLLNRKARETNVQVGSVYFYEPKPFAFSSKIDLLKVIKKSTDDERLVDVINLGFELDENGRVIEADYSDFYNAVVDDIADKLERKSSSY